jgi:hypothetical protein
MVTKKIYPSAAVIMQVYKRDKFKCVYCGVSGSDAELQCDHLHPISKGGSNHASNLRTSCRKCNQAKGDKTDFQSINTNIEMQNKATTEYFFEYKNERGLFWYKTESNLTDETFLVSVIDPFLYEYETIFLKIEDKSKVFFYKDFLEFLRKKDQERWAANDSNKRYYLEMKYLLHLDPTDKGLQDYFKGND